MARNPNTDGTPAKLLEGEIDTRLGPPLRRFLGLGFSRERYHEAELAKTDPGRAEKEIESVFWGYGAKRFRDALPRRSKQSRDLGLLHLRSFHQINDALLECVQIKVHEVSCCTAYVDFINRRRDYPPGPAIDC